MSHVLPGYDGPCRNVHGHSYRLFVTVAGVPVKDAGNPKNGMVIDFSDMKKIVVDGIEYAPSRTFKDGKYCIVRTDSAGVFAGFVESRDGKEVVLTQARRLWYWNGAASLSQLAMEGVKKPEDCKFPCEVTEIILTEAIEIIPCSEKAYKSIKGVPVWEK